MTTDSTDDIMIINSTLLIHVDTDAPYFMLKTCFKTYDPTAKIVNGNLLPHFGLLLRQTLVVAKPCTLFCPKNSREPGLQPVRPNF
ncbi:MAG: hypothetical protein R8J85_09955 [Mariprofundales bacterium]